MLKHKTTAILLVGAMALAPLAGCEDIPASKGTQGAVGVGGALAGAAVAGRHGLLGALIGGAAGAGGGYLIGSQLDKSDEAHRDDAIRASEQAQRNPVSIEQARQAATADISNDGYVTMDEVIAMARAGLSDREMIDRLGRTNQFYELTPEQERYLEDNGVSRNVVVAMRTINSDIRDQAYDRHGNIGRPRY